MESATVARRGSHVVAEVIDRTRWAAALSAAVAAVILTVRLASGVSVADRPSSTATLTLAAVALALSAASIRRLPLGTCGLSGMLSGILTGSVFLLAMILVCHRTWTDVLIVATIVGVGELLTTGRTWRPGSGCDWATLQQSLWGLPVTEMPVIPSRDELDSDVERDIIALPWKETSPRAQQSRFHDSQGVDTIRGYVQVPHSAEQREAKAYVAFCPPFAVLPNVQAECVSGPPAQVIVGETLWHGARLDVRLAGTPRTSGFVTVEYLAKSTARSDH